MRHGERERERERERETLHPREMGRTLENIEVSHLFGLLIADVCILVLLAFIYHIRTRDHHLGDGLLIRTNSSLPSALHLCFKASPSAKPFISKPVLFTCKFWFKNSACSSKLIS